MRTFSIFICILIYILIGLVMILPANAQDIPLFSQKLTNSFIYNPSLAGQTTGSATYTYRKNHANIEGAPEDHFVSIHTPFSGYRFGTGINLYQEKVNSVQSTYATAAFAYHIRNKSYAISAGLSTEFGNTSIIGHSNTNPTVSDPVLNAYQNSSASIDFSFGMHYQTRYVKGGFAVNKINSSWINRESSLPANYFSSYVQGTLRVRKQHDLLEPYLSLRRFSTLYTSWDLGIFYTYLEKITIGGAFRKGNALNSTIGLQITDKILVAYAHEIVTSRVGRLLGTTSEFTLRIDFASYDERKRLLSECITMQPYGRVKTNAQAKKVNAEKKRHTRKKKYSKRRR
jgi:type IX secretion system PorP/SprF family membrane protein